MKIVAVNIGSRSKKYALYDNDQEITKKEFGVSDDDSFSLFLKESGAEKNEFVVGIRIVASGKIFTENKEITRDYLDKLIESKKIASLHIDLVVKEIKYIKNNFNNPKIFAISDSSFHKSIGKVAKTYAIPKNLREEYQIERQGYHGLSLSSVVNTIRKEFGNVPEKIIVAHLGGGSSVSALRDGISIDTSMGWTPLEGIPMTERVGDLDPGIISFLSEKLNKSGVELQRFLSEECGLEAISDISGGNILELLNQEEIISNKSASLALDVYTYKIKKYIGAMSAVLGGCDMFVFTGTVGLRSSPIRERVVQNLEYLNLSIDIEKNNSVCEPANIEFLDNDRKIAVVPINEMFEIAKTVEDIYRQSAR